MRLVTTLLLTLGLAACSPQSAPPWPADLDVPVLDNVGDLPPAAERMIVAVDADGRITVDGDEHTLATLTLLMKERAGVPEEGARPSDLPVVLALDESLPWRATVAVLQTCAMNWVHRVFFGASPRDGREPGAFALFLPSDAGAGPPPPGDRPVMVIRIRPGDGPREPRSLAALAKSWLEKHGAERLRFEVDARASVPTGHVLAVLDTVCTEGAQFATLVGQPFADQGGDWLREEVLRLRAEPVAMALSVPGATLEEATSGPRRKPMARVTGAYAGFDRSPPVYGPPETRIEEFEIELEDGPDAEGELEVERPERR